MKIINKSDLPESIFKYLSVQTYDVEAKGDSLSATEILKPVQMAVLQRRYDSKIVVDALKLLDIMLGNGVHAILEKEEGIEKIERLTFKVAGRDVSGKWDRILQNKITDYKCTKAWAIAYGSSEEDWRKQLSIYRWLYFKVKKVLLDEVGFIVAILKDWDKKSVGKAGYPDKPAVEIPLNLLTVEETERIVTRRVKAVTEAEKLKDDKLPECSAEERWVNAQGKAVRCQSYCFASQFCKQYARERKA